MAANAVFDDWSALFKAWREDIGYDPSLLVDYQFEAKFGDLGEREIEFGAFAGEPKWERLLDVPDQRIRDALLNYVIYQGDTEFASVEQQRDLIDSAPSEYDLRSIARIMREEMRHGCQMSDLLVNYFGTSGKLEAEKLLQRRAYRHNRLLGAFNVEVNDWLDFFVYTEFQDRDGKFQLQMLSRSRFARRAAWGPCCARNRSTWARVTQASSGWSRPGRVPLETLQRYFNKWVPACYDLFGTDHSTSAQWGYTWGIKGRYDEHRDQPADMERLNEDGPRSLPA